MKRVAMIFFLFFLCSMLLLIYYSIRAENLEAELQQVEQERYELEQEVEQLQQRVNHKKDMLIEQQEFQQRIEQFMNEWEFGVFEITGYAPLDPDAVEGMCYEGNPNETYSGEPPIPGVTAAGHVDLIGRKVLIEGVGVRRINDIGGAIGKDNLDLVFATREDALNWGRQDRKVVILP